jgi:hypothetical protein
MANTEDLTAIEKNSLLPSDQSNRFRFFDNREKYLLFVTTCSEKWAIAERAGLELDRLRPRPPALRVFDAGMGDGSVLAHVMRDLHRRHPNVPHLIVGKEISMEDVRLSLEKMADRFAEHPNTVLVVTNMHYSEAPWLRPRIDRPVNWHDIPLTGSSAHEFENQLRSLQSVVDEGWQVGISSRTGNPMYAKPSVLVIYRKDHQFQLHDIIPDKGAGRAEYDFVLAAQPYRARLAAELKVRYVLEPLSRALNEGGRLLVIQGYGNDPGMEIIHEIWPGEAPFKTPRDSLVMALKESLSGREKGIVYPSTADGQSLFNYRLLTMPTEVDNRIGTSTLLAAWNAAVYVAQIEDDRLQNAMTSDAYLDATQRVLQKHGGLWFKDESFVIARRRK